MGARSPLEMQDLTRAAEERHGVMASGLWICTVQEKIHLRPPVWCTAFIIYLILSNTFSSLFSLSDFGFSSVAVRSFEPLFNY